MNRTDLFRVAALATSSLAVSCNQIAGIKPGDPIGSPVACEKDSECPPPAEPECATFVGCKGGQCAYAAELDGKVIIRQVAGDCSQRVCDGKGGVRLQAYDADVEDDENPCTIDTCAGGLVKHTPQQEVPCYTGPAGTAGVGDCKQGIQHCDASFKPVGGCEGEVLPRPETCLTPGDEDCNGKTNEGGESCACQPDAVSPCYDGPSGTSGVGVCQAGTCLCNHAGTACASACTGQVRPAAKEDCSTPTDDDCDGQAVDAEDGCVCVANQTAACYTGPAGTEGVGLCKAGTGTCDATGKGYAVPCTDVVPRPADDCTIAGDDDCDGKAVSGCTGAVGWVKASKTTGQSYYNRVWSIATDAAGNLYAAGTTYGSGNTIDLGGGPLTTAQVAYPAFVVKLAPDGTHLWSKLLPCANYNYASSAPHLAVATGHVALAYTVDSQTCDFGSGTAAPTSGIALVRLDASTGAFVSNAVFGNSSTQLAAFGAGSSGVYLAGYQYSSGTIGGVSLTNQPFLAKVDGSNAVVWAKKFAWSGSSSGSQAGALAVLPDGAVAIAGDVYQGTIDLGAGPLGNASANENHFFGVFGSAGSLRWGKVFSAMPGYGGATEVALAVASTGDVMALGRTIAGFQLGTVAITSGNGYVGRLAAADGTTSLVTQFGMNYSDVLYSLSVDVLGHIGIGSYVWPSAFRIQSLDAAGMQLWQKYVPMTSTSNHGTVLLAPAKDAGLLFTGLISDVQSVDGTMVGTSGQYETVFGKLAP